MSIFARELEIKPKYMTLEEFLEVANAGRPLDTEEIHRFMDEASNEARRLTFRLNTAYHTPAEVRALLLGPGVFINACCHFQDHGGVTIGEGSQIGHNVVFATLNHGIEPKRRKYTVPAPITVGRNVWIGSNSTILSGVTIGDNSIVAAGAVVTRNVPANTVVGGVPARKMKDINVDSE